MTHRLEPAAKNTRDGTMTKEQADASENIAEAMRCFDAMVREAVAAGLRVDLDVIEMHSSRSPGEPIQLISPSVTVRQDA